MLLRLYHLTGNEDYRVRAERVLRSYYEAMEGQPFGFAHMLCAMDQYLHPAKEIVVVGNREDPRTIDLLKNIHQLYLPNKLLQLVGPDQPLADISPILQGKSQIGGQPTVYVCHNFTCSAPVTSWPALKPLLES